jgi:hypothetical protein
MKIYLVMRQYGSSVHPIHAYRSYTKAVLLAKQYKDNEPISYSPCRYYVEETELDDEVLYAFES